MPRIFARDDRLDRAAEELLNLGLLILELLFIGHLLQAAAAADGNMGAKCVHKGKRIPSSFLKSED